MGYKTKSMLKAIGSDHKPKPITSGTQKAIGSDHKPKPITSGAQAPAGAYSRGNKDWNAVKSAINMPDTFTETMTAMGMKIGEAKLLKQKEAKELAERQRIEAANKKAQDDINNPSDGITISEKLSMPQDDINNPSDGITISEKLSMPQPVDLREDYEVPGNIAGQAASTPWFKNPLRMKAPDAFEKGMKRKARYTK
jgi:hypothetical protein